MKSFTAMLIVLLALFTLATAPPPPAHEKSCEHKLLMAELKACGYFCEDKKQEGIEVMLCKYSENVDFNSYEVLRGIQISCCPEYE